MASDAASFPDPAHIYKICTEAAWRQARAEGEVAPSQDDVRDGFIHLSTREQLPGTLVRHFAGSTNLVVLKVSVERLPKGSLRWERSRGGAFFPHLYAPLPTSAVAEVQSTEAALAFATNLSQSPG